ncbi:MAG: hypothetical protein H7249_09575 [Chitinophagaceae bacterium]|nr:hypothetical protein [Oligoflexus sp.]
MHKFARILVVPLLLSVSSCLAFSSNALAVAASPLGGYNRLTLGTAYEQLKTASACGDASEAPGIPGSETIGLSSTICPAGETFALATLLDKKVIALAINWVSWQDGKLLDDDRVKKIPAQMRENYGIPEATIAYESGLGNRDADAVCRDAARQCRIHIWKTNKPERVASLVYASIGESEVPLLFNLNDLCAQKVLKMRLQKRDKTVAH